MDLTIRNRNRAFGSLERKTKIRLFQACTNRAYIVCFANEDFPLIDQMSPTLALQ
jgi:hypothetical protein